MPTNATLPRGLGPKARKLWRGITITYELRPDEIRVLEDACREVDLIDRLQEAIEKGTLFVDGSMGQPVANPLIQEIRQHRAVAARLLGSLKLPEEPDAGERSSAAREAATARWRRGA